MAIGFDDLTLGEVEEITTVALGGKSIDAGDPLMIAGGVMWMSRRREEPTLSWDDFKKTTRMADIKSFSMDMEAANELDPTNARNAQAS